MLIFLSSDLDIIMAVSAAPELRRTRFVCVSDTHNARPADGAFALPPGDVLIHAGDLTKQGTLAELRKAVEWIAAADYEIKIVVAGTCTTPRPCLRKCRPPANTLGLRQPRCSPRRVFLR